MNSGQSTWIGLIVIALTTMGGLACDEGSEPRQQGRDQAQPADPMSRVDTLASGLGGGWRNIDLLVRSTNPLEAAKNCVQRRNGAVSCYAFLSREAYVAAEPSAAGNFSLTCWAARWTRNKLGSVSGGMNEFMPTGCPQSARPERSEPVEETRAETSNVEPFELQLTLDPSVTAAAKIVLGGTTNLPDGTELSTSVSGGGFMGQDGAIVNEGVWQSGPFGPPGGLEAGTYEASVTLPYGRTQPERIQAQLGRRLEKLHGPLMETNPDLEFMGQSATVTTVVTVQ